MQKTTQKSVTIHPSTTPGRTKTKTYLLAEAEAPRLPSPPPTVEAANPWTCRCRSVRGRFSLCRLANPELDVVQVPEWACSRSNPSSPLLTRLIKIQWLKVVCALPSCPASDPLPASPLSLAQARPMATAELALCTRFNCRAKENPDSSMKQARKHHGYAANTMGQPRNLDQHTTVSLFIVMQVGTSQ